MKRSFQVTVAALLCSAGLSSAASAGDLYDLDPDHTQTVFHIDHLGYSTVTGSFRQLKGVLTLDEAHPEQSLVEATIEASSVDTGIPSRDEDLKSSEFFDITRHQTLTFRTTKVKRRGPRSADLSGELTLLGISKPVTLRTTFNRIAPDPLRNNRVVAGFTATTTIRRSDFGMKAFIPLIGDVVRIDINAEAIRR
ncbi:YceI family protein [Labrys sp. LIt4]|uniref:YceI family protein n=1 Tax=Labrys sp. LIt4 TaxID=2821355 RepID=UPI001ADFAB51|nr:YceI family protein [Labrys sp. LIt4]MBP0578446.1 YceI family protein [Labrys sp. LIt4]